MELWNGVRNRGEADEDNNNKNELKEIVYDHGCIAIPYILCAS